MSQETTPRTALDMSSKLWAWLYRLDENKTEYLSAADVIIWLFCTLLWYFRLFPLSMQEYFWSTCVGILFFYVGSFSSLIEISTKTIWHTLKIYYLPKCIASLLPMVTLKIELKFKFKVQNIWLHDKKSILLWSNVFFLLL